MFLGKGLEEREDKRVLYSDVIVNENFNFFYFYFVILGFIDNYSR